MAVAAIVALWVFASRWLVVRVLVVFVVVPVTVMSGVLGVMRAGRRMRDGLARSRGPAGCQRRRRVAVVPDHERPEDGKERHHGCGDTETEEVRGRQPAPPSLAANG